MPLASRAISANSEQELTVKSMKTLHVSNFRVVALGCFLLLCALMPGCSKKGGVAIDNSIFNSAPPALKEKWDAAAHCAGSKDYLGTATNLIDIFGKTQELSPAQVEALNDAWVKLGNEAFAAANYGDKNATDAVLKMKETGIGERRSR